MVEEDWACVGGIPVTVAVDGLGCAIGVSNGDEAVSAHSPLLIANMATPDQLNAIRIRNAGLSFMSTAMKIDAVRKQ